MEDFYDETEEVIKYVKRWGLGEFVRNFVQHRVTMTKFVNLRRSSGELKQLVPLIGPRVRLCKMINGIQESILPGKHGSNLRFDVRDFRIAAAEPTSEGWNVGERDARKIALHLKNWGLADYTDIFVDEQVDMEEFINLGSPENSSRLLELVQHNGHAAELRENIKKLQRLCWTPAPQPPEREAAKLGKRRLEIDTTEGEGSDDRGPCSKVNVNLDKVADEGMNWTPCRDVSVGVSKLTIKKEKENLEPCTKVKVGVGKVANAVRLKYLKGRRYEAPYVRLTCLTEEIPEGHECALFAYSGDMRIRKRICVPARQLVDIMHLALTGKETLVGKNSEGFKCDMISLAERRLVYDIVSRKNECGAGPFAKRPENIPPPNAKHEACPKITGMWSVCCYLRGGLFFGSGEGKCDEDPMHIFPLCHGKQMRAVFAAIDEWLEKDFETRELLIESRVPERVNLFHMPEKRNEYEYRSSSLRDHWPELSSEEEKALIERTVSQTFITGDTEENPNADFTEDYENDQSDSTDDESDEGDSD